MNRNFFIFFKLFIFFTFSLSVIAKSQLKDLNETTWIQILQGEWFILFYAPWCPACKQMAPVWKEFAEWGEDLSIEVAQVDVTSNPGLTGRFMITALPTVYHVKNGVFRQYIGQRDKDALFSFIEEKKWTKIDPVPAWSSPQSYCMSIVAYFFKLSMSLRDMHNYLTTDMGLHYWTAHGIFGVATILTGILLGLLIVAIIDCMYSARRWFSKSGPEKDSHDSLNNDLQPLTEEEIMEDINSEEEKKEDVCENDILATGDSRQANFLNDSNEIKETCDRPKSLHSSSEDLSSFRDLTHRKIKPSDSGDQPLVGNEGKGDVKKDL